MARHHEIYSTAEWRKVRKFIIAQAQGLCEECQRQGRIEAGKEVDHIIELTDSNKHLWEIAYNPDNLQLLCPMCHNVKHGRCSGLHFFADP